MLQALELTGKESAEHQDLAAALPADLQPEGNSMTDPTQPQRSRLTEPSSAAGFAALLALLVPSVADQAPAA